MSTIRPNRFLGLCNRLKPDFRIPYEQQDTSHFLYFLLDRLHDELKVEDTPEHRASYATGDYETDPFSYFCDTPEYIKWNDNLLKHEGVSPINRAFQIQQQTTLECGRCRFKSKNYDYSSMLHLNLNGSEQYLETLIRQNLKPENLSEDLGNAWKCPNCEKLARELDDLREKAKELLEVQLEEEPVHVVQKQPKKRSRFFRIGSSKSHEEDVRVTSASTVPRASWVVKPLPKNTWSSSSCQASW
ncbi:unnamed protein product [Ambrosiozyma monospora]|uniref:Unnamed protein product n=1 Tax=Ambrosiozyma monospora TaxID=43982 RepID=A0ACB5TU68_AMBMO|nr:unnamed protein product [Ambrosiozyma monospora]